MSSKYKVRDQEMLYFLTFTIIDWVDLFTRPVLKHVIIDSLKFFQQSKGLISEPEEYKYSSAGIYAGRSGVLEIEKL